MGSDYSGCFGQERNKMNQNQGMMPSILDTWSHETRQAKVMVSPEEAYMIKKQTALQIHFIPCNKIKNLFMQGVITHIDTDISPLDFCLKLTRLKLLKADLPRTDERWKRFYSKLVVVEEDENEVKERFGLVSTLIALIFLSQGTADTKSRAICDLFTEGQGLKDSVPGISKYRSQSGRNLAGEFTDRDINELRDTILEKQQLSCIISVIVNMSLIILPIYASDYPRKDKRDYYTTLMRWFKISKAVIQHYI